MYMLKNQKGSFAILALIVCAGIAVLAIGFFVIKGTKGSSTSSSEITGSISCTFSSDPEVLTTSTNSFKISYTVTNNSNQAVDVKWYVTDKNVTPTSGDLAASVSAGNKATASITYTGSPTTAFTTSIGAYANGGTIPGSGSGTCVKAWKIT